MSPSPFALDVLTLAPTLVLTQVWLNLLEKAADDKGGKLAGLGKKGLGKMAGLGGLNSTSSKKYMTRTGLTNALVGLGFTAEAAENTFAEIDELNPFSTGTIMFAQFRPWLDGTQRRIQRARKLTLRTKRRPSIDTPLLEVRWTEPYLILSYLILSYLILSYLILSYLITLHSRRCAGQSRFCVRSSRRCFCSPLSQPLT